jgi:LysR family transcriptional regulator, hca operon transcriptional activator
LVAKEPIVVILPSDHPLAEHKAIDPHDLVGEKFIGISNVPRVLRGVVGDYLKRWPFLWSRRRAVWLCCRSVQSIS